MPEDHLEKLKYNKYSNALTSFREYINKIFAKKLSIFFILYLNIGSKIIWYLNFRWHAEQ